MATRRSVLAFLPLEAPLVWQTHGRRALHCFKLVMMALALLSSTGCGVISALTNPSAAFALSESAGMSVVVRRAEVAEVTAQQVERLLGDTGVDDKSKWIEKTALKKADAEKILKEIAQGSPYAGTPGVQLKVVPAEAWAITLSNICSTETQHENLLAALSPEVGKAYGAVAKGQKDIAKLKEQIASQEKALDAENITEAATQAIEQKKAKLEEEIAKLEEAHAPKVEEFLAKLKEGAEKASPDTKTRLGGVFINLKRAVDDAKLANSVAIVRYPIAMPGMTDDVQSAVKRIIADVIEEQTGTRPDPGGFKPDVKLDGLDVKLTINGVPAEKLGDMSMGDLIKQTTVRTKDYMGRVLELVPYAGTTQDLLSFETDILDAVIDGMGIDPETATGAGEDLSDLEVLSGAPGAAVAKAATTKDDEEAKPGEAKKGKRTPGGLMGFSCNAPEKAPVVTAKKDDESEDKEKEDKEKEDKEVATVKTTGDKKPKHTDTKVGDTKASGDAKPAVAAVDSKPKGPGRAISSDDDSQPTIVKTGPSKPPATSKPAAPPTPPTPPAQPDKPPAKPADKPCDVWVTSGDKKICL